MDIGTIKKTTIEENQDSSKKFIMLEVEESEGDDLQDVQLVSLSGIKSRPEPGERVYILDFGGGLKIGICVEDNIEMDKEEGERDLYATDGGSRKAALTLLKNGNAVINDGDDYAVRFSELESKFNELRDFVNDFITTTYNLHNHPTAPTGPVSVPSSLGSASTVDITPAKIDTVRVP
jgi:phage gp45-like